MRAKSKRRKMGVVRRGGGIIKGWEKKKFCLRKRKESKCFTGRETRKTGIKMEGVINNMRKRRPGGVSF